jgi:hypothetical protein
MALLLCIALLAFLCSSIRARLARRERAPGRLLNMGRIRATRPPAENPAATRKDRGGCEKDAGTPAAEAAAGERKHLPKRARVDRSRYGEMLPS